MWKGVAGEVRRSHTNHQSTNHQMRATEVWMYSDRWVGRVTDLDVVGRVPVPGVDGLAELEKLGQHRGGHLPGIKPPEELTHLWGGKGVKGERGADREGKAPRPVLGSCTFLG